MEGEEGGGGLGLAHELRKNPKNSANGSSSLLSGWALPELRPLGPAPPPARCKLRKKKEKKETQNKNRPQNTEMYMRGKQGRRPGRRKLGGVKSFVYMSTEKNTT